MREKVGGENSKGGGRSLQADPNLPRWACQNCRHPLSVVGVDAYAEKYMNDSSSSSYRSGLLGSSVHGTGSILASSHMDHSFVVLPKQKSHAQGISHRPRSAAVPPEASHTGKNMEESFVVLPPAPASVYRTDATSDGNGAHMPSSEGDTSCHPNGSGFHSTISILKRAFEISTSQTQIEQPLCLECMKVLCDKLDKEVEDVNRDIKAYEACLQRLEGEKHDILSEADFLKEKQKFEEEERKLEAEIKEAEKQCAKVNDELKELELKSTRFNELEERYWNEFNNFQFQLISYQEERDAILAKIEVSLAHLDLLKRTNVLNDAFPIFHDGEFGTINNFRLGRLPKNPVEWDEINAAWGQACLLLHTMCHYFMPKFHYRIKILPMGSYPRIMDIGNNTYDLFGPVNLFWSTRYDKAMTLFLTCLKDFAEFARIKDLENNIPPDKCFKLPYKIDNDKVETYSITQSFNKPENWTKALKYTLCNLKWALYWFVGNTNFQPQSSTSSISTQHEMGTSHARRAAAGFKPSKT